MGKKGQAPGTGRPKKERKEGGPKDGRRRVWAFEVYPDSAPADWMGQLAEMHVRAFVSPLHDHDKHPDGAAKKAHYHVEVMFDGKKSLDQVREAFGGIASNGYVEAVESLEGYARYLCHMDNPEKAQYQVSDVRCLGGADYLTTINCEADKIKVIGEMQEYCITEGVINFADLMIYAKACQPTWYRSLCTSTSALMVRFCKALEYRETGEAKRKAAAVRAQMEKEAAEMKDQMAAWDQRRQKIREQIRLAVRSGFVVDAELKAAFFPFGIERDSNDV